MQQVSQAISVICSEVFLWHTY